MKKTFLLCFALGLLALFLVLGSGCSERTTWSAPDVGLESVMTSHPPRIDGRAFDTEWFLAPELIVAAGDEFGNAGGNFYVRIKSVYTPYPDTVYFLLQWRDDVDDVFPDRLIYEGQLWHARNCSFDMGLVAPESWGKRPREIEREDRLCFAFEITPAGDASGAFASRGCKIACHGGMRPTSGLLDMWYWLDARTNQVGYCDDMYADSAGLSGDAGESIWRINWRDPTFVPKFIVRRDNGGLSPAKIVFDAGAFGRQFNQCDTINPYSGKVWGDSLNPDGFDYVPGYLSKPPTGSRADVFAKAEWREGLWTIEINRAMRTGHESEDVAFYPDRTYNFAIAIMNGSREIHSGSAPLVLRFNTHFMF